MVITALLAVALQAAPAPAGQTSVALICRMAGVLSPDSRLEPFPQMRVFGILVTRAGGTYIPARTLDPTGLLRGRSLSVFHELPNMAGSYGGATGTQTSDPATMQVIFQPRPADNFPNQYQAAIAPLNSGPPSRPVVGLCLKLDNMTEPEFERLTSPAAEAGR